MKLKLFFSLLLPISLFGNPIIVQWNALSNPNVIGYKFYYGYKTRQYTNSIDVGNSTNYTFAPAKLGTNYVALTAYAVSSETVYSSEISFVVTNLSTLNQPDNLRIISLP